MLHCVKHLGRGWGWKAVCHAERSEASGGAWMRREAVCHAERSGFEVLWGASIRHRFVFTTLRTPGSSRESIYHTKPQRANAVKHQVGRVCGSNSSAPG